MRRSTRFVIAVIVAVSPAAILMPHESRIAVSVVIVVTVVVIGPVDDPAFDAKASMGFVWSTPKNEVACESNVHPPENVWEIDTV